MEEHFIYSRPVVVTEDKIKEALAKQANQKALKAALDQQIQEAERLKAEAHRAKGKKRAAAAAAAGRSNGTPAPLPPPTHAAENSSGAGPSPPSRGEQQDGGRDVAPTRYTFSFKEGHGTFEMTDRSARPLQETLQPSSAEGRSRAGGGGDSGGLASGQQDKKRAHSKNSPLPARRTPSSREGREREPRKPSPGAAAAPAGGEYQTNSLPANFKLGKDAGGARKPASREQPRRLSSREKGSERSTGDAAGGYDTQSLPVELIYKLSQGNALPAVGPGANHSGQPPSRVKLPHPPRLTSPSASRISDSMGMRSPMSLNSIPSNGHASAVRDRSVPLSPRSEDRSGRPPPSPRGGKASARLATPLDSPGGGGRLSGRPTGGFLPPLGGRRESDTIEMSAVFDPRTPTREHDAGGPRRRVSGDGRHDRSPPPPGASPPSDAAAAELARKLAEREKGWAQQVKQLKAELRKARQKAGAGKGGKAEEAAGRPPRRAETAPDPPAHPPGRGPRGAAAAAVSNGNGNGAGGATGRARRAEGGGDHNAPLARPTRLEKMDFSKAHIFSRDTFRPITAPEDANSYFGNLLASPLPRTPLPLEKPKPSPLPTQPLASAAAAKRDLESRVTAKAASFSPDQSDSATHKTATQNSAHTATSGEESLKLASLTTRQVTLGLPDYGDGEPVPIEFMHLQQFVDAQIITANQAANLWDFFALAVPAELGGSGDGDAGEGEQGRDGRGHDNAEMESHTIEVEEMAAPRRASAGSSRHEAERAEEEEEQEGGGDDHDDDDDDDGFFVPHSPSVPPPNAVLAPALRRKISQLHSEEAAMLLQHHQQLRNGRQRPSLPTSEMAPRRTSSSSSGRGKSGAARQAAAGRKTSPAQEARPPRPASTDSEGEGTFDTYSELRLSRNVRASGGD